MVISLVHAVCFFKSFYIYHVNKAQQAVPLRWRISFEGFNPCLRSVQTVGWGVQGNSFGSVIYDDRIIRTEDELNRIRQYILDNPLNWETDEENSHGKSK